MTEGPATTAGARGVLSWLLLPLAAATLVAAVAVSWARGVLFDPAGFAATALPALEGEAWEAALRETPRELGQIEQELDPAGGTWVAEDGPAYLDRVHAVLVRGRKEDPTVSLRWVPSAPQPATEPRAVDVVVDVALPRATALPALEELDAETQPMPYLLLAAAFLLALAGVRLAPDRGEAAGRFVLLATVLAALAAVYVGWGAGWGGTAAARPAEAAWIEHGGSLLRASLRSRLLIVAVAGGLLLLLRWRVLRNAREAGELEATA